MRTRYARGRRSYSFSDKQFRGSRAQKRKQRRRRRRLVLYRLTRSPGHAAIIVNKKFTSDRSGRTHYSNDGSAPSIFPGPAAPRPVIAYFSRGPATAAAAGPGSIFHYARLKRRLRVTIFNGISEVFMYPRREVSAAIRARRPSPIGEYVCDRLSR